MAQKSDSLMDRLLFRRAIAAWERSGEAAEEMDLADLKRLRGRAWQLRRRLDRVIHTAEGRLTRPLVGSNALRTPLGCDWAWRPELFRGPLWPPGAASVANDTPIGSEAKLFHDCPHAEIGLRQTRNTHAEDLAPFGLRVEVFRFDGSFLSLMIDLPDEAVSGLRRRHVIRVETLIEREAPMTVYARLNIGHGPNVEQVVQEFPPGDGIVAAEFDLAYTHLNEKRADRMWLDVILDCPEMNQVILRDVTLSRRPRAEL